MPVLSERVHPEAELDASDIRLSGSDIPPEEENHPFPAELLPETGEAATFEADALLIPDDRFDDLGVYAYHLQVAQTEFVRFARANGGSPVSMLTALLSELIRAQFPEAGKDIVCGIPHQLRGVLHGAANRRGLRVMEGVYAFTSGPAFETPAEIRAYGHLGADVVGMSTVPEAVFAHACGMQVAGL